VKFDDDLEFKLSPQRHLERIGAPVVLLYGTRETPEFQRQSIDFDKALRDSGKSSRLVVAEEYDHFELKETLANPYGPYGQAVMSQIFP
jgi:arylformamidase